MSRDDTDPTRGTDERLRQRARLIAERRAFSKVYQWALNHDGSEAVVVEFKWEEDDVVLEVIFTAAGRRYQATTGHDVFLVDPL